MLETKRTEIHTITVIEGLQESSEDFDSRVKKAISLALSQHVKLAINTSPENRGSSAITRISVSHKIVEKEQNV